MARNTLNSVDTDISGEKVVAWIWQHQHLRPGLATSGGDSLQVIFPGRRNGLGGPDFRGAILVTPQGQCRGDVEVHLLSSLWQAHGHHRDPAYNSVVLHVVMWHDSRTPIYLHSGCQVPTLALAAYVLGQEQAGRPRRRELCRQLPWQPGRLARLLDSQGEARFKAKAALFGDRMKQEAAAQVLYEGVMEALGYSRNQEAFRQLAQQLPLAEVEAAAQSSGPEAVQSLLLGRAGLVPHAPAPGQAITPCGGIHWQWQGVRPGNQPAHRLAALSYLLVRYAAVGWLPGLMAAVERAAREGSQRDVEAALAVPSLLGRSRAGDIAVNILLPFAYAYGLGQESTQLYRGYPALGGNEITREMSALLGCGKKLVNSARRQQGLIHLFKNFCAERRCRLCPLGTS